MLTNKLLLFYILLTLLFVNNVFSKEESCDFNVKCEVSCKINSDTIKLHLTFTNNSSCKYFIPISKWIMKTSMTGIDLADNYLFTPYIALIPIDDSRPLDWSINDEFDNFEYVEYFPKIIFIDNETKTIDIVLKNEEAIKVMKKSKIENWSLKIWVPITPIQVYHKINQIKNNNLEEKSENSETVSRISIISEYVDNVLKLEQSKIGCYGTNNTFYFFNDSGIKATKTESELLMIAFMNHLTARTIITLQE